MWRISARTLHKVLACAVAMSTVIALASCGAATDESSDDSNGNANISFMLDWTPNTNHIGLYVAQQLGYYSAEHVKVDILPTAQAGAETSVENGVADIGFTTLSNVAAFNTQGSSLKFVFDLTQKPVARWCALASRTDIKTPKDLDGKTFVSFGSAEQTAVVRQMIRYAGGTGNIETATAGTNTFDTLTSGKGDFGGFYATWENVESELNGPALHCFVASDWGVPGNPDQLGFAVKRSWLVKKGNAQALQRFLNATMKGYDYALAHPDKAASMLVSGAKEANLSSKLAHKSMEEIASKGYWTTSTGSTSLPGTVNMAQAQDYLDFQYKAGTYKDAKGKVGSDAPQASDLATNAYATKAAAVAEQ
ncbi:ABC transporter substrate-binding protein [Bifidobacterium aquikefiri]|uniref:ABC transporter substrate-binding protein n=1 Tax=Bifidobacterium aquikefiri TaxID=1653207 RepID=UPI0039EA7128